MKLRKVKPTDIKWPEVRVTAQFDEELLQQFKESIKAIGQITPIICYAVNEELVGCDGKHRCDEAIAKGEPTVDVVEIPGDMVDVLTKNILLDHLRGKTKVSQMVTVIKALYQEYNLDPDQIKEKTGLTRDYIEKLIIISQASPELQEALDRELIGVGKAFEIARLPSFIIQDEVVAQCKLFNFTTPELHERIDKILEEMELLKKAPPVVPGEVDKQPRMYICEGCKHDVEPRYIRPAMLCPDCFGRVWRLAKAADTSEQGSGEERDTP